MTLPSATLNGHNVTDARLSIPAWGASYHDVALDQEVTLSGSVTLTVADLTITGTVLSGGPGVGRSFFRIVAGAGGWGKTIASKAYQNDAGVKLATVLNDAAQAVGETIDQTTLDQSARLGSFYVRPEGPACTVLNLESAQAWYVGEDGVTRIGARPASTLTGTATRVTQQDQARGTLTLASDTIAGILPGIVVDGLTAVDVEHEISIKGGLRTKLWGKQATGTSRRLSAWKALIDQLLPQLPYLGCYEYRVVTQNSNRLNLQPVKVSTGMPDLANVMMRPGVAGANMQPALGSRVLVGFVNADPAFPVVLAFEDPDGSGFMPLTLTFEASTAIALLTGGSPVARVGDQVMSFLPPTLPVVGTVSGSLFAGTITVTNPITGMITQGSAKVTCG